MAICQAHKLPKTHLESVTGGDRSGTILSYAQVNGNWGQVRGKNGNPLLLPQSVNCDTIGRADVDLAVGNCWQDELVAGPQVVALQGRLVPVVDVVRDVRGILRV